MFLILHACSIYRTMKLTVNKIVPEGQNS